MTDLDRTVLPDPDSPTTPRVLAPVECERHAVDRSYEAPVGDERRAELVDLQEGTLPALLTEGKRAAFFAFRITRFLRRMSKRERRRSPM